MGGGEEEMWGVVMVSGPTIKSLRSVRAFSFVRPITAILRVWLSGSMNHCSRSDWEGGAWGGGGEERERERERNREQLHVHDGTRGTRLRQTELLKKS